MRIIVNAYSVLAGLSLRAGRLGIFSGYHGGNPRLLSYKSRGKIESKEIPSRLIRLLVVFNQQVEILATTLELLGNLKPIYLFTWTWVTFLLNEIKVRTSNLTQVQVSM